MKKRIFTFITLFALTTTFPYSSGATISIPDPDPVLASTPLPSDLNTAVEKFKHLSKKERKELIRKVKSEVKLYKAQKRGGEDASTNTLLLVILSILLPPLAVYLHDGEINTHFWIDLILTLIFWIPGVIYALIIVLGKG